MQLYCQLVVDCGENFVHYEDGLIVYDNGKGGPEAAAYKKLRIPMKGCAKDCREKEDCTSFAYVKDIKKNVQKGKKTCWMWIKKYSSRGNPYSINKPGYVYCQKGNKYHSPL